MRLETLYLTMALGLGLMVLPGCDELFHARAARSTDFTVSISEVEAPARETWGLTVADFDGDGDDDFLLAGHGGALRDRIYLYDGEHYRPAAYEFPRAPDRHGCAAADLNGDKRPDVYCTAGAERGEGENANELFLSQGPAGRYQPIREEFGAEDRFGRGRLVRFLQANGDNAPDLYATVWGDRQDGKPNSSRLYLNRSEAGNTPWFEPQDSPANGRWGGRCLAIIDLTGDGLDDLVACHELQGATLLVNRAGLFSAQPLPFAHDWWLDIAVLPASTGNADGGIDAAPATLAALVLDDKGGSLQLFDGAALARGDLAAKQRVALRHLPQEMARRCIPGSLALTDANGDGAMDVFISRVQHDERLLACNEAPDIVLLGPGFFDYLLVPGPENGKRAQSYAANGHFIRLEAGEGWTGKVTVIRLLPATPHPLPTSQGDADP